MTNGYGYPLFVFSYHFPWMIGMPFILAGMGVIPTIKLLFAVAFSLSGVTFYMLAHALAKNKLAATVGALLYLFAPYHFLSIYVSASIGSVFLFTLLPLLFYGIVLLLDRKIIPGVVTVALTSAAMVLTHLMSIAIFFPFLLILVIALLLGFGRSLKTVPQQLGLLAIGALCAVLLTAFYLVPLIQYLPLTQAVEKGNGLVGLHRSNLVRFSQLVYSPWGFGPITDTALDGQISFQVGIAHWLVLGMAVGMLLIFVVLTKLKSAKKNAVLKFLQNAVSVPSQQNKILIAGVLISLSFTLWTMTTSAMKFWDFFAEKLIAIDYPFRLLLLAVFSASLLGSLLLAQIKNKQISWTVGIFLVVVALYTNRNHIRVNMYTDFDLDLYVRSELTTNTFNEYAPKGTETFISKEPKSFLEQDIPYTIQKRNTAETDFTLTTKKEESVTVNMFDFPGQTVFIQEKQVPHTAAGGRIQFTAPAGLSTVRIVFVRPAVQQWSLYVSALTLATLIGLSTYHLTKKRSQNS
jgi:hypothetical protein